jgi:hypothetical protein
MINNFPPFCGRLTRSTSAPFRVGYNPIQPIMSSRCLSAAGLRFLDLPSPSGISGHPYGGRTDRGQIPGGLSRSAPSRGDWGGCLLYSGVVVSLPEAWVLSRPLPPGEVPGRLTQHCRRYQSSCPATSIYGASPKIHLRSPVQSFPGLGRVDD